MNKMLLIIAGLAVATPSLAEEATVDSPATLAAPTEQAAEKLADGTVARSTFTNGIAEREPVDAINKLGTNNKKIYYFSELRGMAGQTVTHRWEHDGKIMAEVPFTVNGNRWRVFSSKNLEESWQGEWKVSVIDQSGGTLAVNTFSYEKEAADNTATDAAAQPIETPMESNEAPKQ
jgi:membrane-bound ClpP family serine protease